MGDSKMLSAKPQLCGPAIVGTSSPPVEAMCPGKPLRRGCDFESNCRFAKKVFLCMLVITLIVATGGATIGILTRKSTRDTAVNKASNEQSDSNIDYYVATTSNDSNSGIDSAQRNRFNIELVFLNSVSEAQRQAFIKAKARWEQVIVGDIPTEARIERGDLVCNVLTFRDIQIDDILIFVDIGPIDGEGKVLGRAGPCAFGMFNLRDNFSCKVY